MKSTLKLWHLATVALLAASPGAEAPAQSCHDVQLQSPQLREQEVHVSLRLGYARTEILQTVYNPNPAAVEAVFHFPVPGSAAIAEVEIGDGESTIRGEVMSEGDVDRLYQSRSSTAAAAGIARRIENGDLEIRVHALKPETETRVRLVTYALHVLHGGEGRYDYPTQSAVELPGRELWRPQTELHGLFRLTVDLLYAAPIERIAVPGFEGPVQITQVADDHVRVVLEAEPGELAGAATLNYAIKPPAEGAVDLTAHRADVEDSGVFMMLLTPPAGFSAEASDGATPVLHFPGGRISETTELDARTLNEGGQQIVFGRYVEAGRNRLVLNEGQDWMNARHDTLVAFPDRDEEFPELERLWANERSRTLEAMAEQGLYSREAANADAALLGRRYQVLNGSNAMLLLGNAGFESLGLTRLNEPRVRAERLAQSMRAGLPVWRTRVDLADAFFIPRGRQEGECCFGHAVSKPAEAYGVDLNPRPQARRMAAQGIRYW